MDRTVEMQKTVYEEQKLEMYPSIGGTDCRDGIERIGCTDQCCQIGACQLCQKN